MKTTQIKTIDVNAKEWFDKTYGNSYFAAIITINYGLKNEKQIKLPFQYGYGDHYRHQAFKKIKRELNCFKAIDNNTSYWRAYEKYNIIARHTMQENCLKRELKNI